jgi:hypothetical protein
VDKKPLIVVSLCAVVLLVLGSLSNVVGYQSVSSTTVDDSPLFTTRTQRATNQQQHILISQYIGLGKGNLLQFPIRDNRTEQLKKAVDIISKMDDNTFYEFTKLCIQNGRQDINLKNANSNEILRILYMLRTNPETITKYYMNRNNQNITSSEMNTVCNWSPGCIFHDLVIILGWIIIILIDVIFSLILYTNVQTCSPNPSFCSNYRCMDNQNIQYPLEELLS